MKTTNSNGQVLTNIITSQTLNTNLKHQTETFITGAEVLKKLLIRQLNKDQTTYFYGKFLQNIEQRILGGRIFSSTIMTCN